MLIECSDSIKCETELLKIFKKEFIKSKEYGNEYFEGDKNKMKNIIFNYIENNKNLREIKSDMKVNQNIKDIEINNKLKNDKDKDIEINNKLKSKYCHKCKTIFKYPSFLKNHITNSVRCKLNEIELIDFYKTIEESKTNTFNCKHCKSSFTRNSTLLFHNRNSKCGKEQLYKKNKVKKQNLEIERNKQLLEIQIVKLKVV